MYFIDREKIKATLDFLHTQINIFNKIDNLSDEFQRSTLERVGHMMIDCVLDVGNAMIDGFIMRDPGSYDDIIDILLDEKVITDEMSVEFKKVIICRKALVQNYLEIDHEEIYETLKNGLFAFEQYPERIEDYLQNELGPVSAFKA